MTTYVNFQPTSSANFQFPVILDGNTYTVIVTWNLFGQRYYFNLYNATGALILSSALIGSPLGADINLIAGYFITSTLVFRTPTQNFEITP